MLDNAFTRCLVGLLIATGVSCSEPPPKRPPVVRPVKMLTIGDAGTGGPREYPGKITAAQHAEMAFEVPGRIIELPVDEGQKVAKGTALAKLDPRDYQADLDASNAMLRKARADLNRTERLFAQDPGAIALTQIDADRRGVEVAEAQMRQTEKAYEDTILTAPFDGVVAMKLVRDFANVQAKDPVLILQDTSLLEMVVNVPERDFVVVERTGTREDRIASLNPRVVLSALPDRSFPARLKEMATTADPVTRTFAVKFRFDNPANATVLPGMTAKIVVDAPTETTSIWIPIQAATADEQGAAFVWLVDTKTMTVAKRPVQLGTMSSADIEVTGGLSKGDVVAVSGVQELRDGMQVRRFES